MLALEGKHVRVCHGLRPCPLVGGPGSPNRGRAATRGGRRTRPMAVTCCCCAGAGLKTGVTPATSGLSGRGGPDNLFVRGAKRQEEAARTCRQRVNCSLWRRRPIRARSASECINMTFALAGKPPVAPNEWVSASCRPRLASNRGYPIPQASRLEPQAFLTTSATPRRGQGTPLRLPSVPIRFTRQQLHLPQPRSGSLWPVRHRL